MPPEAEVFPPGAVVLPPEAEVFPPEAVVVPPEAEVFPRRGSPAGLGVAARQASIQAAGASRGDGASCINAAGAHGASAGASDWRTARATAGCRLSRYAGRAPLCEWCYLNRRFPRHERHHYCCGEALK